MCVELQVLIGCRDRIRFEHVIGMTAALARRGPDGEGFTIQKQLRHRNCGQRSNPLLAGTAGETLRACSISSTR